MLLFYRMVFVAACLLSLTKLGWAKPGDIFIDPKDPTAILREVDGGGTEPLLRSQDLPTESVLHPVHFVSQHFTYLAVNPDKTILAFSVQAGDHEWSGLYYLSNKDIRQLNLRFEAKSMAPYWSKDSRYLVVEEEESNRRRFLEVFDLEKDDRCVLDGRLAKNKFMNFLEPWWSESGDRLFFKAEINNFYRKSNGLKPLKSSELIGEASPKCQRVVLKPAAKVDTQAILSPAANE